MAKAAPSALFLAPDLSPEGAREKGRAWPC